MIAYLFIAHTKTILIYNYDHDFEVIIVKNPKKVQHFYFFKGVFQIQEGTTNLLKHKRMIFKKLFLNRYWLMNK